MSVRVARGARIIVVALLLGLSLLLPTGSAIAGGPTSVLLVSPSQEHAAALYTSDPEYDQLLQLLGEAPAEGASAASRPADMTSAYVTVTWLIHDVSIWRIDRVFLPVGGEPLVVTQEMWDGNGSADGMYPGESGSAAAISHRSPDPAALIALLGKLGVANADRSADGSDASVTPVAALGPAPTEADGLAAGWWLLAGLIGGVVVCALTIRFVPAVRRGLMGESDGTGGNSGGEPVPMVKLPV